MHNSSQTNLKNQPRQIMAENNNVYEMMRKKKYAIFFNDKKC